MSWGKLSLGVACATMSGVGAFKYLEKKASLCVKNNKLEIKEHIRKLSVVAPYGILEGCNVTVTPGSELNPKTIKPIVLYFKVLDYLPYHKYPAPCTAERKWKLEERENGDYGHVSQLQMSCDPNNEKVAYYTEVALLALGHGFSMPKVYLGPTHTHHDFKKDDCIRVISGKEDWDVEIVTPIGTFEKHTFGEEMCYYENQNDLLKNIDSKPKCKFSNYVHTQSNNQKKEDWLEVRDQVFMNVNERVKGKKS